MLQHESQEQPTPMPAAQVRVTSQELAQAINALEASKDEAARRLAGTVPIGQVVEELKLEATPEEVWAQVQKQRAQVQQTKAQQAEAQSAVTVRVTVNGRAAALSPAVRRRGMRTWRDIKGWLWILFWCGGGMGLVSGVLHSSHLTAPTITVNGDHGTYTYNATGRDVEINGDGSTIYVHGTPLSVTVNGDNDKVITDTARNVEVNGDNDTVNWIGTPTGEITDRGHNNRVAPQHP